MSFATPLFAKVASGVLASTLLVAGGAAVLARQGGESSSAHAEGAGAAAGTKDTVVVVDPVTGARRVVKKNSPEAKAAAAAASGTSATGSASGGGASASGQVNSPGSGGTQTVSVDGGGAPVVPGGGGPGGSGPGPTDPAGTDPVVGPDGAPPSAPNLGVPVPAAPSAPSAPDAPGTPGTPAFDHGSYSVVVPGTPAISKRLCLSGTVNRCKTVNVPAMSPVTLTVAYSSNTSVEPPTFTPNRCAGGLSLTVTGLSSGAAVTADAQGNLVSASVDESGPTQSASLCDA